MTSANNDSTPSPYATPTTPSLKEHSGKVSPLIIQRFSGMKSWLYFLSILSSITLALGVLFSFLTFLGHGPSGTSRSLASALLFLLTSGVCIFPVLQLFRICRGISTLQHTYSMDSLDQILTHMQAFWKHLGMIAGSLSFFWLLRLFFQL